MKTNPTPFDKNNEEKKVHENFAERFQDINTPEITSNDPAGGNNAYANMPSLPFEDNLQKVVLLNITHRNQIPKSKLPGFRICGAFPDIEKLKKHVNSVGGTSAYGGANLLKADSHKKFLICSSFEKQQNSTYVLNKIDEITKKYMGILQKHEEEFKENKEARRQGKTGLSQNEKIKKHSTRKQLLDKKFDEEKETGTETGEVSRNSEVRGQMVAVISIIEDNTPSVLNGLEDPEPVIIIWGCFESETHAKHYIYNTASKYVKDVVLDVVNMYEWCFPSEIAKQVDNIDEEYRNPALNKIMKARKTQKAKVLSYEEWLKQEDQTAPVLEITATKETEDSTEVKTLIKKTEEAFGTIHVSTRENNKDDTKEGEDLHNAPDWKELPTVSNKTTDKYKEAQFKDESAVEAPTKTNSTTAPKKRGRPATKNTKLEKNEDNGLKPPPASIRDNNNHNTTTSSDEGLGRPSPTQRKKK